MASAKDATSEGLDREAVAFCKAALVKFEARDLARALTKATAEDEAYASYRKKLVSLRRVFAEAKAQSGADVGWEASTHGQLLQKQAKAEAQLAEKEAKGNAKLAQAYSLGYASTESFDKALLTSRKAFAGSASAYVYEQAEAEADDTALPRDF